MGVNRALTVFFFFFFLFVALKVGHLYTDNTIYKNVIMFDDLIDIIL